MEHYEQILEHLKILENYRIGKENLIKARNLKVNDNIEEYEVQELVERNAITRKNITRITQNMLHKMRVQINGTRLDTAQ